MNSEAHGGIIVRGLTHIYRSRKSPAIPVLDGITFDAAPGEIVGILGPNGAGKTTCARILSTLLRPTDGYALVGGRDVVREARKVRALCGVSFGGDLGLYSRLTSLENLEYFGSMYQMRWSAIRKRSLALLDQFELLDRRDQKVETLSRGMRQRLHIARALINDPEVLILDEPTAGLDPRTALVLRELVQEIAYNHRAILLMTHDLIEAEALCSKVIVMDKGHILAQDSPRRLRAEINEKIGTLVEVKGELTHEVIKLLAESTCVLRYDHSDDGLLINTSSPVEVADLVMQHRGKDTAISISPPSLTEAYLNLVRATSGD